MVLMCFGNSSMPSAFLGGDEASREAVYNQTHSLQELISPDKFKPYAELKAKLNEMLGESAPMSTAELYLSLLF